MTLTSVPPAASPARILAVDDEEIVLVALRETFRQQGCAVDVAPNAVQGLEMLRQHSYAVVITDQLMPMLTGLEFLAEVRNLQPWAARILITAGLNMKSMADAVNKAEIYRFLQKPWQREDLLGAVRSGIERYEALMKNQDDLRRAAEENERLTRHIATLEEKLRNNG